MTPIRRGTSAVDINVMHINAPGINVIDINAADISVIDSALGANPNSDP